MFERGSGVKALSFSPCSQLPICYSFRFSFRSVPFRCRFVAVSFLCVCFRFVSRYFFLFLVFVSVRFSFRFISFSFHSFYFCFVSHIFFSLRFVSFRFVSFRFSLRFSSRLVFRFVSLCSLSFRIVLLLFPCRFVWFVAVTFRFGSVPFRSISTRFSLRFRYVPFQFANHDVSLSISLMGSIGASFNRASRDSLRQPRRS